jgi:hypothetical protein
MPETSAGGPSTVCGTSFIPPGITTSLGARVRVESPMVTAGGAVRLLHGLPADWINHRRTNSTRLLFQCGLVGLCRRALRRCGRHSSLRLCDGCLRRLEVSLAGNRLISQRGVRGSDSGSGRAHLGLEPIHLVLKILEIGGTSTVAPCSSNVSFCCAASSSDCACWTTSGRPPRCITFNFASCAS